MSLNVSGFEDKSPRSPRPFMIQLEKELKAEEESVDQQMLKYP